MANIRDGLTLTEQQLEEIIERARKNLKDEAHVEWALDRSADLNEGALVHADMAIVMLANRLESAAKREP